MNLYKPDVVISYLVKYKPKIKLYLSSMAKAAKCYKRRYKISMIHTQDGKFYYYEKPFTEYYANELNYLQIGKYLKLYDYHEFIITSATVEQILPIILSMQLIILLAITWQSFN
ncbi:hypothetical protein T4D_11398 [Trichinella pseudospiralis]|uniref:Uncharacterized protein n=1 Tax=Trichinella pseudospiralis TaxID=6337 RepID=A0A0V1FHT3_TRIPS|nr:hypothetical protein T4D_11398 [Trichinella pseudospiralis]